MTILRLPVRFVMDCDAKPRYLGARRLSLSWTRQELCDTTDHINYNTRFVVGALTDCF